MYQVCYLSGSLFIGFVDYHICYLSGLLFMDVWSWRNPSGGVRELTPAENCHTWRKMTQKNQTGDLHVKKLVLSYSPSLPAHAFQLGQNLSLGESRLLECIYFTYIIFQ